MDSHTCSKKKEPHLVPVRSIHKMFCPCFQQRVCWMNFSSVRRVRNCNCQVCFWQQVRQLFVLCQTGSTIFHSCELQSPLLEFSLCFQSTQAFRQYTPHELLAQLSLGLQLSDLKCLQFGSDQQLPRLNHHHSIQLIMAAS